MWEPRHHTSDGGLDTLYKREPREEDPRIVRYAGMAAVAPVAAVYSPNLPAARPVPPTPSSDPAWEQDELAEGREEPLNREIVAAYPYYAAAAAEKPSPHTLCREGVHKRCLE